jgi:hypothetical protein
LLHPLPPPELDRTEGEVRWQETIDSLDRLRSLGTAPTTTYIREYPLSSGMPNDDSTHRHVGNPTPPDVQVCSRRKPSVNYRPHGLGLASLASIAPGSLARRLDRISNRRCGVLDCSALRAARLLLVRLRLSGRRRSRVSGLSGGSLDLAGCLVKRDSAHVG